MLVAPSVLDVRDEELQAMIKELSDKGADWIHIDVIDWKRTSARRDYNPKLLKDIKESKFYDVHLMVDDIKDYIDRYQDIADNLTIHSKSLELIHYIRGLGRKAGIAVNPDEMFEDFREVLPYIDVLLFMTVYPGYGGQKFIKDVLVQIQKAVDYRVKNNLSFKIQVDGGINAESFSLVKGKVDIIVAGSFIIKSQDKQEPINFLRGE